MKTLIYLMLLPLFILWRGFALSVLWKWFIVPLGVPALSVPMACGLLVVVGVLTHKTRRADHMPEEHDQLLVALIMPPMMLFIGWIITLFM